jgi:hypothetical protein
MNRLESSKKKAFFLDFLTLEDQQVVPKGRSRTTIERMVITQKSTALKHSLVLKSC